MRKLFILLITITFYCAIVSCQGPSGPAGKDNPYDKQVSLTMDLQGRDGAYDQWHSFIAILKFDKRNYIGVDSIVFSVFTYVTDTTYNHIIELFDYDTGDSIPNSRIITNIDLKHAKYVESVNIFKYLPDKEITLGIRHKSSDPKNSAVIGNGYLFMFRK